MGRIDFADLPAFTNKTETALLQQYLNKNARYRTGQIVLSDRATLGEFLSFPLPKKDYNHVNDPVIVAARANATRWYGIGPGKLVDADIYNQTSADYQWGFQADNGSPQWHQGAGGVLHYTTDFVNPPNEPHVAFYFILGSWFADWNLTNNNFLRATLATPNYGLASFGFSTSELIPFEMQNLGLGEPLANAMLQTCAALGNNIPRWLTIIGDPTLRLKMPAPVSDFTAVRSGSDQNLSWNPVSEAASYYVYRSTTGIDGPWLPHLAITTETSYVDAGAPANALYMVRAAILTTTACGSYTNLTEGVFAP